MNTTQSEKRQQLHKDIEAVRHQLTIALQNERSARTKYLRSLRRGMLPGVKTGQASYVKAVGVVRALKQLESELLDEYQKPRSDPPTGVLGLVGVE